jgi:hypothetical protein
MIREKAESPGADVAPNHMTFTTGFIQTSLLSHFHLERDTT